MRVLTKYISVEIIKFFVLCQFIFILLFLVIDFIRKIDRFIEAQVSLTLTLLYFIYKIPTMLVLMIPVAAIISVIIVICLMKKNMEVMAMKACGLNLLKSFQPVIIISLIISFFSLFLAEIIVPYTSSRSNEIMEIDVNKRPQATFQEWYKSGKNKYWIRHFDIETGTMTNPVFYFFNDNFRLTKKISGETCSWKNGEWQIKNARILKLNKDDKYTVENKSGYILDIPEKPETFIKKIMKPEDMSYAQLKKHARKTKKAGYDNTSHLVNLNSKLAFPFISAVLALIAIPIGLWEKINNIPLAITIGITACFLFLVVSGFSEALGLLGILPPFLAAWTANILFSLLGINLLMNIKR